MKKIATLLMALLLTCAVSDAQPNYMFSSGTTTMVPISNPLPFTWNATTANDEEYSTATNIGFSFVYDNTSFTQFQVSTNGFLQFGSSLAAATPTDALNGALRNVLAPLWDDLAVSATASDIQYELSGTSGSQVLTVEWRNVKWNKTASASNAEFQIKLYEADGKIEFIYGTMSAPTAGSASIGLNDATASGTWGTFQSINVGGSGSNFHVSMVYVFNAIANAPATGTLLTFTQQSVVPISGSFTVGGTSPDFATPSIAVLALNLNGISASVTLNIRSGTYDDIIHLINVAGTSATKTITIQKESGTVTLSPRNGSRNGSASTTADFAVAMLGTDYTTFDGINILHNTSNSSGTLQFEFGYFMANYNGTDGATYNTIKNASITGSNTAASPTNFRGIRTSGGGFTSVTAASGAVSYNTFKNLTIQQCGMAIYISGMNGTFPDIGNTVTADPSYAGNTTGYNDLGSLSISTTASGIRGIFVDAQDSLTIEKCEVRNITNSNTTATNDVVGIGAFTSNTSKVLTIQNNIIRALTGSGTTTQVVYGIWMVSGTKVTVKNNLVYDLQAGSASTGTVRGILHNIASTTANNVYLVGNMVYDLRNPGYTTTASSTAWAIRGIELNSADSVWLINNTVYINATTSQTTNYFGSAAVYSASSSASDLTIYNNIIVNTSAISGHASSRAVAFAASATGIGARMIASDNNIYYAGTADASHLLLFDGTNSVQTIAALQTILTSPRELNSFSAVPGFVNTSSPYNPQISTSSFVPNGQGRPFIINNGPTNTTDIHGDARSTSLSNGPVDIGADEYTPTGSASTTASGTIADGNTTTYTGVDGKIAAEITWTAGSGSLPTSVTVTYTPGMQATSTVNPSIYRAFTISETGGAAGWSADVKLYYNASTELKGFTESSMRINKYTSSWSVLSTTINTTNHYGQATVTSFSNFSFDDGTNALPVELKGLTASTRQRSVELRWSTATETNNFGFEVERAVNGVWTKIGFVPGAGTSNTPKEYHYADAVSGSGTYSYRLKQIDIDGKFTYHAAVEVTVSASVNNYELAQNFPNPFNPATTIRFSVKQQEHASVKVYDVSGRQVAELFNGVAEAGQVYNVQFNGAGLASGIYFYVLQTASHRDVKKMQLLK